MKLYFMIGLPTEEEEDVREIPQVGGRARAIGKRVKKRARAARARRRSRSASRRTCPSRTRRSSGARWTRPESSARSSAGSRKRRAPRASTSQMHDCDTSWLEARLRARRSHARATCSSAPTARGARFDSWEDQKKMAVWEEAFRAEGIDPATYLGTIPVTARLPWDHIDVGLEEGFLAPRVPQGAEEPPLARRAARSPARSCTRRTCATRRPRTGSSSATTAASPATSSAMREQRLVYLRKLGAEEPRAAAPPPRGAGQGRRRRADRPGRGAAVPLRLREARRRARSSRTSTSSARCRAPSAGSSCPLFYSQGFHPEAGHDVRPRAVARASSSLCEVVDMKIAADLDADALLEELSAGAQPGPALRRRRAARRRTIRRYHAVIDVARLRGRASRAPWSQRGGGEAWLRDRIAEALAATRARAWSRRIDGIGKRVDVRDFLRSMADRRTTGPRALARAGIVGDLVAVAVEVDVRGSGGVKIAEVVEAVWRCRAPAPRRARRARHSACADAIARPRPLGAREALRAPCRTTRPARRSAAPAATSDRARRRA